VWSVALSAAGKEFVVSSSLERRRGCCCCQNLSSFVLSRWGLLVVLIGAEEFVDTALPKRCGWDAGDYPIRSSARCVGANRCFVGTVFGWFVFSSLFIVFVDLAVWPHTVVRLSLESPRALLTQLPRCCGSYHYTDEHREMLRQCHP
jgi:hypothetical protein